MFLKWLRLYLNNRMQQIIIKFNNKWLDWLTIEHDVPQESGLDSLLFIIYINDIIKVCPDECKIKNSHMISWFMLVVTIIRSWNIKWISHLMQ